jgi:catechol 2,3-dioxygenase-like lactoylglutathione lyase family enzyme
MPLPTGAHLQCFVMTADRSRTLPFYRDVLGLPLVSEDEYAAAFDLGGGAQLRLTSHAGWQPHPHTVVGWEVPDIGAAVDGLAAHGITAEIYEGFGQDERGIWHSPAASLAWFKDPDGNVLSYAQRHAN